MVSWKADCGKAVSQKVGFDAEIFLRIIIRKGRAGDELGQRERLRRVVAEGEVELCCKSPDPTLGDALVLEACLSPLQVRPKGYAQGRAVMSCYVPHALAGCVTLGEAVSFH